MGKHAHVGALQRFHASLVNIYVGRLSLAYRRYTYGDIGTVLVGIYTCKGRREGERQSSPGA